MTRAHAPAASPLPLGVASRGGHGRLALRALRRLERSRSAASNTGRPRKRRWRSTAASSCAGWLRRRSPRSRRRTPRGTWGRWVNVLSALLEGAAPVCTPDGSKGSARSLRHLSACRGLWSSPQLAREMRLLPPHATRWATLSSSTPRARASSAAPRRRLAPFPAPRRRPRWARSAHARADLRATPRRASAMLAGCAEGREVGPAGARQHDVERLRACVRLAVRRVHGMDATCTKARGVPVTGGVVICVALYLSVCTAVRTADFVCVCVLYMW